MKLRNIPFRKQQPKFNCCTSIRSILPVKSLLISHAFILLFITIGVIELYAAPPSPLLLETGFDCNSDGKLKVSFLSTLIDNSQDDSWSDDTSPGVILKVNGTIVFEGNYGLDSHSNGSLSSHKKADGVTFSEVAGPQIDGNSTKKVVVIVPLSYLSSGSNDINLSGTWKERVESGSDKNTPIDETKQESITLPEAPTGASSSIDADGKVTLTWSNPSGDYTGIKIYRNGSEKATITDGKSSWTDPTANMNQESYGILAYADHPSCTGKFSFSSEAAVQAPAPPKVSKPAGLTASTGRCDGKILVSWDYNGDVEPTSFILSIGGTDKTLNGDLREYLDETVGTHTTRSYTIKAKGPINTSDATTAVSGSTSGPPDQPGSISANGYVSQNRIYIDWGNSDHHNKYLLIRNSSSGSSEFEISKTQSNFNDNTVNGCEMYTYEVYASNACTEAEGIAGIKASGTASERLEPNLSSYLTFFDASKAYYPDKVVLEWEVQNNNLAMVDAFEVLRRKAGTGSYSVVGTVSGEAYFEDKTALGGTLYEYQLKSRLDCDNKNISSNTLYAVGFRIPYGIVNGNISYENGVNVKGVDVMADKGNEPIGRSLSFGGSGKVTVTNDGQLNPANNLAVEAWIRPSSTSGSPAIISKFDGSRGYKLYHENSDVVFTANINGGLQTVRAQNVLKLNEYTHVSGVYEGNTLKIFIDGKVPVDVSYQVDQEELDYLALSGVTTEVISLLEPMKGTNYTDPVLFTNQLINLLDSGLALSINPILMPMAKIVEYQPGTVITGISGSVINTTGSLIIGDGFRGNIDEIRIWNKARDEERVFYDYKRIVGNDENGLAAYWRCEENFGTYIYDVSKSGGEFHKNDGTFSGVTWSSEIPNRYQLGWMGKTDANGDYTIPYVPYFGSGENFTITPIYEQHQFELKSKTVFLGEGSTILSEQNFTDISSFKVTGTVFYQDTYCGVEGAIVGIDGEPVIKNGKPIYTDQFGKFEIAVPVGEHFVYVQKSGHEFISHKFPPGPETATFNFQEPINGINFVDKTKVTVVGRVVGGTIEGDKKPGLGLSVNNIGVAEFRFECATCEGQWAVTTDAATGEFRAELPPMKYLINKGDFIYKNPAVGIYFSSLPEADFSLVNPKTLVTHTYSGVVDMKIEIDSVQRQATLDIDGITDPVVIENIDLIEGNTKARFFYQGNAYQYPLEGATTTVFEKIEGNNSTDSTWYNYRYDLIYRSAPEIRVTAKDGESPFTGDRVVRFEDPVSRTMKEFDLETYPFQYPLFTQNKSYELNILAEEVYYNQDNCPGINGCEEAIEDRVLVNDAQAMISNQLAAIKNPAPVALNSGKGVYTFRAGEPQVMVDANFPWRSYSGVFNISVRVDNILYEWKPVEHKDSLNFVYPEATLHPDDKYFRGYVLGANPIEGSDFITEGPQLVDMILRDPPGSESFSYIEKGTTFTFEESFSMASSVNPYMNVNVSMGAEFASGLGHSIKTEIEADANLGVSITRSSGSEGSLTQEMTVTNRWETSDSPELAGAPSDLFYGSSTNYSVSLADNLGIFPVDFANNNGLPTAGIEAGEAGKTYKIGLNKTLMAAPTGSPTQFIFTADHIENYLIPNLINVRNNLFINDSKYKSKLDHSHELYGSNNDDPAWGEQATSDNPISTVAADFDGPSYTFTKASPDDKDMIRKYNEQIRLWQSALERNEMEKYSAELLKNISFDAGPTYEHTTETSLTTSNSTSFELDLSVDASASVGAYIGGIGGSVELGMAIERNIGHTTTTTNTTTNTFGYVLHDPDQGDYFSVDVKDPQTGTGPVFTIKGGRSMCPHEKATSFNYYTPAKYKITQELIDELEALNANVDFLKILSRQEPSVEYTIDEFSSAFNIDSKVASSIPESGKFLIPQVKERHFTKRHELENAINTIINLNLNLSEDPDLADLFSLSLDDLTEGETQDLSEHLETDSTTGGNRVYVFKPEQREEYKKEFLRYQHLIYEKSSIPVKNVSELDVATIRREVPVATISPALMENVPEDNLAYFTLALGNNSYTDETMWYEARIIEASNPNGAVIKIDNNDVERIYEIGPGEIINKTVAVAMGRDDVYKYDELKIVFYAKCEFEFYTNGRSMDPEAVDTVTFSVHYVPSCTDVDIAKPSDDYIVNIGNEHLVEGVKQTKVPVLLSGYDLNNTIFDQMTFQFKSVANPTWIDTHNFYVVPEEGQEGIEGNFTALEWDLSGYPDGEYDLRAKTKCGATPDGTEIFDLSEVWTGVVDRKPPQVFGSPQPADGILSPDDDIIVDFNEEIFGEKLTELANFDIRGILNGTELRHDVSVGFDNDSKQFVRIPDGINLAGKSFTVEFWLKPDRAFTEEVFFSQSTNPSDAITIKTTMDGKFEFQVGIESYKEENLSLDELMGAWHHFAFVFDQVRNEVIVMMDGVPYGSGNLNANYTGFGDIYLGKSLNGTARPFQGNLHELRIWERPRTTSQVAANMLITLSGKETGLVGYWPFDDAYGTLAAEKVHKRNATVNAYWDITPSGYAATFNASQKGVIDLNFSDIAFTPEEDFTIEFWFKSKDGVNKTFLSNGHGDNNDMVLYYITPAGLHNIERVLLLEESVKSKLEPMVNKIYESEDAFLADAGAYLGAGKEVRYKEQLLRFGKQMPTYWCINTDASGNIQVSNNGKRIKYSEENFFDNQWHHLALVVQRIGNTRLFVDGELKVSEPSAEWNGFGAARLFVGARGLFKQSLPGFEFDQHFNGSMDEVRIWSTALKQTQIQRNSVMRLDGDELALKAYLPFESYEELMGVPAINGILSDMISDRESVTNLGVSSQNTDVPNVRMVRPSSKVDFSFVYKSDQIAFVINEPIAKIENCILDITVRNVEDMYGNKMSSPVTWSAYVDMNQVKWDQQQIQLEKKIYDPLTFTSTVVNNSGLQQNYSIENLPGWMTATPQSGTLAPLTQQEITFTVNEGVNIGDYSRNIHLQTDFDFDEKLMVNLRVFENLPDDWQVEPSDFENSMNLVGMVKVNNVISTDRFDKVAAFVDGACRGIAYLHYVEEYDMYEVFMDIYSNEVSGEYFELHIWDASEGREYRMVSALGLKEAPVPYTGLYEFIDNTVYGSPSAPISLEANNIIIKKIPLADGWNWRSFNIEMDVAKPLTNQLEGLQAQRGDMVKGLTSYSEYSDYWIGTLNYLEPEQMYMFKVDQADTLKVSGKVVEPEQTPIEIVKGWNWIGYTPQSNMEINDAFGRFTPNHGDLVKSQFAFAMYDELMGWVGTLSFLQPDQGYKYKYLPQGDALLKQDLTFPNLGSLLRTGSGQDHNPIAGYNQYPYNMSLIATLQNEEADQLTRGKIQVWSDDSLRGEGASLLLPNQESLFFLTIYGEQPLDSLQLKYVDLQNQVYPINQTLAFTPSGLTGSIDQPFRLSLIQEKIMDEGTPDFKVYPNPFKDEFMLNINQNTEIDLEILNLLGERLQYLPQQKGPEIRIKSANFKPGIYFIRFGLNGKTVYHKIIKE